MQVIGFHVDRQRIDEVRVGRDRMREVEADDLKHASLRFENNPLAWPLPIFTSSPCRRRSRAHAVQNPTPCSRLPRLDCVLKRGDIVV
jgi:UDP-N-acetyl-D-galactosamine dehydrogenase